jgi:hypothetical protein
MNKELFEHMLELNMRSELAGSMDSMEMREILQKGIELFDTVESPQQYIAVLEKQVDVEGQQKVIESLQAQVAGLKEALSKIDSCIERDVIMFAKGAGFGIWNEIKQVLSTTPATYHNPADVEALARAREALQYYSNAQNWELYMHQNCLVAKPDKAKEALAAIDKAGAGE